MFCRQGAAFSEIFANNTSRHYGSLLTTDGPVAIAENGVQLVVVDGSYGYVFDLSTHAWTQITSPNFYGSSRVAFVDNYLVFVKPNSQQFYWTSLAGVTFDALDFASAEGAPDQIRSLLVAHRELWLFGATSTEVWFNVGELDQPFARIAGAFLQHGTAAAQSPTLVGESVCWLGSSAEGAGLVFLAVGYQPQRISTHAVEHAMTGYPTVSDALGWSEQREGHLWFVLTFPSGNATWVYDLTSQLWHERAYLTPATGSWGGTVPMPTPTLSGNTSWGITRMAASMSWTRRPIRMTAMPSNGCGAVRISRRRTSRMSSTICCNWTWRPAAGWMAG